MTFLDNCSSVDVDIFEIVKNTPKIKNNMMGITIKRMSLTCIEVNGFDVRDIIKNDGYSMFMNDFICYF